MDIFLIILAFIVAILGVTGSLLPVLPGPPLSFAAILLAKLSSMSVLSTKLIWIMFFTALAITIFDFISPSIITKKFGGSSLAAKLSLVGMIIGTFFFPPFGMIIGPFLGAFIGEFIYNRKASNALKIAFLSFIAFLVNTGIKFFYALISIFIIIKGLIS